MHEGPIDEQTLIIDDAPQVIESGSSFGSEPADATHEMMIFPIGLDGQEAVHDPSQTEAGPYRIDGRKIKLRVDGAPAALKGILMTLGAEDQYLTVRGFTTQGKIIVQLAGIESFGLLSWQELVRMDAGMTETIQEDPNEIQDPFNIPR